MKKSQHKKTNYTKTMSVLPFCYKMEILEKIFETLGYSKYEAELWITLYKLWTKPASTIASAIWKERTGVYKSLRQLAASDIIKQTKKKWTTHFRVQDIWSLYAALDKKKYAIEALQSTQDTLKQELLRIDTNRYPHFPQISLYDWHDWVKSLCNNLYETVIDNNYLVIKFFATNTFEAQSTSQKKISDYYQGIFDKLYKHKVKVDTYLWNWMLIMEQINNTSNISIIEWLPAGQRCINIMVVWTCIYIIIFKHTPIGIKIESSELANTLHFLLDKVQIT